MYSEKRKFPRVSSKRVTHCLKNGPGTLREEQRNIISTRDLSYEGAKVLIQGEVNPGERLTLVLRLPLVFFPIFIDGEIRWTKDYAVSSNGISNMMEAGIKFLNIDATDRSKIEKFIAKQPKPNTNKFALVDY